MNAAHHISPTPSTPGETVRWIEFLLHPEDDLVWFRRHGEGHWTLCPPEMAEAVTPDLDSVVSRFHFWHEREVDNTDPDNPVTHYYFLEEDPPDEPTEVLLMPGSRPGGLVRASRPGGEE